MTPTRYPRACQTLAASMLVLANLNSAAAAEATNENPAVREQETRLPGVTVRDHRDKDGAGYQGGTTRVGKVNQLPRDVPQSLTIVTEKLMEDRSADTLKEALRNVTGLTFNAGEGGRNGDNITIRGYSVVGDLYLDGIRDIAQYNRELFNLEQIDVLRGSASMLFGRGSTGGIINQVSKGAMLDNQSDVSVTYGSYDYKRATADLNYQIGEASAARLTVMGTDAGSFRKGAQYKRYGMAPTISTGIGDANEFWVSYYYLEESNVPDYGVPYYMGKPVEISPKTFLGLANADYEKYQTHIATVGHIHRFSTDTSLRTVLRYGRYHRDLWPSAPRLNLSSTGGVLTDNTLVTRSNPGREGTDKTLTGQMDFDTKLQTGSLMHQVLLGFEYLHENSFTERFGHVSGVVVPSTPIGNPDTSPVLPVNFFDRNVTQSTRFKADTIGIYGQDTVELGDGWKIIGGFRWDRFKGDYERIGPLDDYARIDKVWSWRTGLMYQPDDVQSYYVSYGTSFNPSGELYSLDPRGSNTPPEKNRNIEAGAKFELLQGNLSLRTALFRSEKTNERNTDPLVTDVFLLSGKRHTDGLEFEVAGRITPDWDAFGGIARLWAAIDESVTPGQEGMRPINTPKYTANFWTTYRITGHWRIGGGFEAVGKRYTSLLNTTYLPSYVRWDSMLSYNQGFYEIQLNIFNILNKTYYEGLYTGHAVPGTVRTAHVKLGVKF